MRRTIALTSTLNKTKTYKEKRDKYILPAVKHLYKDAPLFVKGKNQFLYDETGKEYLDLFAGIVTVSVGHCNDRVLEATIKQASTLQHTSTIFMTQPMVDLAEKLAKITPGNLEVSFITNSGTEANEAAIRLARLKSGKSEVIALEHSYHGESHLASSLTGNHNWRPNLPAANSIVFAANPYCYRCPFKKTPDNCSLECVKDVERVIQTQTSGSAACMIAEPIQGVGGAITPPDDYFKELMVVLKKYGIYLIADEVQTGFGRTGQAMFGITSYGVEPHIMTMAKGLANGIPIGAMITTSEMAQACSKQQINTFGGNPISCATAIAVIDTVVEEKLMENCHNIGNYLLNSLKELQKDFPILADIRGKGLMLGVEIADKDKTPLTDLTAKIVEDLKDNGIIIGKGGIFGNVLRIKPPMIVNKGNIEMFLQQFQKTLTKLK